MSDDAQHSEAEHDRPRTALEEVMREIEDAERRADDQQAERRHNGEAGEAITPNTRAEEESRGD
ncbi:hypothetical protein [Streptomyces aurantiogriseus]|uniref:Uncharacterized protein n=1 Tax=Streptomyces aurantiogriseus TaxID=66870 RepID=A0A918FD14_9ACTN|nr:hypothetical protein [Streptomyces aurantiogriseus]GGR32157.1 hypothetical protein GCM10010251_55290 [Streptomyces aurantiogriseus]